MRGEPCFAQRREHLAEERLARSEPAVHRRARQAELARDRLHIDALAGEEAVGRERERVLARGGGGRPGRPVATGVMPEPRRARAGIVRAGADERGIPPLIEQR